MKAAVLYAKGDIRYADYEEPQVGPGQVKVAVKAVGVCGSDIPRVWGDAAHFFPVVLGHEFSGVVTAVGEGVTRVAVGDHVSGAPLVPCMTCEVCQQGFYSQCKSYSFIGSREQGAFGEYVVMPEANAVPLDPAVPFTVGAFIEPSTVGLHGLFCAEYRAGEDVAILGGGTIGLLTAQWCKIFGAKSVSVFDIDNDRLAVARELGMEHTFNTLEAGYQEQALAVTGGKGFGFVFETAGNPITMNMAFDLAAAKASVCFIGTSPRPVSFDAKRFELMNRKEFRLTGSWMSFSAPFPGREWSLTAHYMATGQFKVIPGMLHATYPLSQCKEAFDEFQIPGRVKGKIMFVND